MVLFVISPLPLQDTLFKIVRVTLLFQGGEFLKELQHPELCAPSPAKGEITVSIYNSFNFLIDSVMLMIISVINFPLSVKAEQQM